MDTEDELSVRIRLFRNGMMCGYSFSLAGNASEVQIVDTVWVLKYLTELNEHNSREWFNAHKAETKAATEQFEELVQALILRIGEFDSSVLHIQPKDTAFTLIRYPRFGQDRTPYNPVFRAHIASKGKLPVPVGYYLMIKPGNQSYLGGGLFANSFRDATEMIRAYITEFGEEFDEIIHAPEFEKHFTVQGTSLLRIPHGYDREHPQAEYLKFKSWYLKYSVADEVIADAEQFMEEAAKLFEIMKPFNDYLNKALKGFQMPTR